uniref:Uncharacterized protein n=1 Tax=Rhabditophanes sp. KR3021 TaxID=114890 RepID=A0AC35U9B2_9BILA
MSTEDIERGKYIPIPAKSVVKTSICEIPGYTPKPSVSGRLSTHIVSQKQNRIIPPGGQLFLCIIGSALSLGICIWLAFFSNDAQWRRLLIAGGAALCAFMFAGLAFSTCRKKDEYPIDEISPALLIAQRRATLSAQRPSVAINIKEASYTD